MRRTIYLPVIVLITILFSCTEEPKPVAFDAENIYFEPMKTWETLAKTHPDSILFLLKSDIFAADSQQNSEEFFQKVVLFYKISLQQHYELNDTILITQAACFYDSLAKHTPPPSSPEMQNLQWMRATAHFLLGKTQQDQYQFLAATENHIAALKILDQWFYDSKKQEVLLLRGDIEFYLGDVFYYLGYLGTAKTLYEESLETYLKTTDSAAIARGYWSLGDLAEMTEPGETIDTASYYAKKGLEYVNEKDNPYETSLLLGVYGNIYRFYGKYDSAIYYFKKAIEIIPPIHEYKYMLYASLGVVYFFEQNYDSALFYTLKGCEVKNILKKHASIIGVSTIYLILEDIEKITEYTKIEKELQFKINQIELQNTNVQTLYDNYIKNKFLQKYRNLNIFYFPLILIILCCVGLIIFIIHRIKIKKWKKEIKQNLKTINELENEIKCNEQETNELKQKIANNIKEYNKFEEIVKNKQQYNEELEKELFENQKEKEQLDAKLFDNQQKMKLIKQQYEEQKDKNEQLAIQLKKNKLEKSDEKRQQKKIKIFQRQKSEFQQTDIFQTIISRCPDAKDFTWEKIDESDKWLWIEEKQQLRNELNAFFNDGIQKLSNRYPTLNETDITYCMLSLFIFSEKEITVLMNSYHQSFVSCKKRVNEKLKTNNINEFLTNFLINEML